MNISLVEQGPSEGGKQYLVVELETYNELLIGVLAFCERYEMSFTFNRVVSYGHYLAEFTIEGFGEDIDLFVHEYELR